MYAHWPVRMLKWSSCKAAGELKSKAYPLGYVEGFHEPSTKLVITFSIRGELDAT